MTAWSETFLQLAWTQFWQLTLVILVVGAAVKLACRRRPHLAYMLWMIVLLKAVTPAVWSSPTSVFSWTSRTPEAGVAMELSSNRPTAAEAPYDLDADHSQTAEFSASQVDRSSPRPASAAAASPSAVKSVEAPRTRWMSADAGVMLLVIVWSMGAIGYLIYSMGTVWRCRRAIAQHRVAVDDSLVALTADLARRLRIGRSVPVAVVDAAIGPLSLGSFRPLIVLPQALLARPIDEIEPIVAHELIHVRRRDGLAGLLQIVVQALWWFHPLVWFVNHAIATERERACDEEVISELAYEPRRYGRSLLGVLELKRQWRLPAAVPGIRSFEVTRRRLEHLITYSKSFRRRMPRRYWLVLLVGLAIAVPGAALTRLPSPKPATAAPPAAKKPDKKAPDKKADEKADAGDAWSVEGRVVDHRGEPVSNAEVLLLGPERIIVDAPRRNWIVLRTEAGELPKPESVRTDAQGRFSIQRQDGLGNRLAVIAADPMFWEIDRDKIQGQPAEIRLPESGSLSIDCDLPGKPDNQPVNIELRTFDGQKWDGDMLRFHFGSLTIKNPGVTTFEHLPPGQYAVQRNQMTKTGPNQNLIVLCDRQLVEVKPAQTAAIAINRKTGRPISGKVSGLEGVELRNALVMIRYFGPEEDPGKDGKFRRYGTFFDAIPIDASGEFTTDPIPPGEYTAEVTAMKATTSNQSPQQHDFQGQREFTVPAGGEMPKVEIRAKPRKPERRTSAKPGDAERPGLRVVDRQGRPVPKFEIKVWTVGQGSSPWLIGAKGKIEQNQPLWGHAAADALQLTVRAEGYASQVAHFAGSEREKLSRGQATLTMDPGEEVQINFRLAEGKTWPADVKPQLFFADVAKEVHMLWNPANQRVYAEHGLPDYDVLRAESDTDGTTRLRLTADSAPFYVAVHAPGFVRFCQSGPFTLADFKHGKLEVAIAPANLKLHFDAGATPADQRPFESQALNVLWKIPGSAGVIPAIDDREGSSQSEWQFDDLAAGNYSVQLRTKPRADVQTITTGDRPINPGAFMDFDDVTLKPGETQQLEFRYQPFDAQAFRGKRTATVRVLKADGSPAAGRQTTVSYFDGHYGYIVVFSGPVPDSGEIQLQGITDRGFAVLPAGPYRVNSGMEQLGQFGFKSKKDSESFEFRVPPAAGDLAPEVELVDLKTGETSKLSEFRGKVVFLEFWASWCGPCREPLQKLNQLAAEKRDAWKDKVALIGLSIDDTQQAAAEHVARGGLDQMAQYWSGGAEQTRWQSAAARAFVVSGVPTAVLIDRDGRIVWRGHPNQVWNSKPAAVGQASNWAATIESLLAE